MPAATSGKNLPYPLGTDRVMDGDDAIRKLAQSVDNMAQGGNSTVNVVTGGSSTNLALTFPVAYSATPNVVAIDTTANAQTTQKVAVTSISNTGFTCSAIRASAGPVGFQWIAVGPVAAVA